MALKLIDTVAPCLDYEPFSGSTGGYWVYNPELITPPRQYVESISSVNQFFYDPVEDVYIAYLWLDYAFWPSWRARRIVWAGGSGALSTTHQPTGAAILFTHWTNHISVGGYNKFYATGNSFLNVKEIDWKAQNWLSWSCNDWTGHPVFHQAIVNREDKLLVGNDLSRVFSIYNYDTGALLGKVASLWSTLNGYMCYESNTHFWVVYGTGQLAKINYQTRRHEILTAVQSPAPEDLTYLCAFDTNRKRLAVLRHKTDAADGACRLQLEFYQPVPQAQVITAPVPVNSLTTGARITFSAHVLGSAGEGAAARTVLASLAGPTAGSLVTGRLLTGQGGGLDIGYMASDDNAAETLTVATEVEE